MHDKGLAKFAFDLNLPLEVVEDGYLAIALIAPQFLEIVRRYT